MIAEGSIFYTSLLIDEASMPDAILDNIPTGENPVMFPVNIATTYGNAIMPDSLVNIYVKLVKEDGKIVYGRMYENIKILAVRDSNGKNVFENTDEERMPAYVYFSLPEAQYLLFSSLRYITDSDIEVVIVPNTMEYEAGDDYETEITSEDLYDFVVKKISMIDDQQQLYKEFLKNYTEYLNKKEQKKLNENNNNNNQ